MGAFSIAVGTALLGLRHLVIPSHWLELKLFLSATGLAFVVLGVLTLHV